MNKTQLLVFNTIKTAWHKVKGSKKTFFAVTFLTFLIEIFQRHFLDLEKTNLTHTLAISLGILTILFLFIQMMLTAGIIYLGVQKADDQPIRFDMLKQVFTWEIFFKLLGYFLLVFIVLIPVFVLFLFAFFIHSEIPQPVSAHLSENLNAVKSLGAALLYLISFILGLYIVMRLYIGKIFVIKEKASPWLAMKKSFHATQSKVWKLLGLSIINLLIIIVSILPFGIGLIWSIPYFYINYGIVYRTLTRDQ